MRLPHHKARVEAGKLTGRDPGRRAIRRGVRVPAASVERGAVPGRRGGEVATVDPVTIVSKADDGGVRGKARVVVRVVAAVRPKRIAVKMRGPATLADVLVAAVDLHGHTRNAGRQREGAQLWTEAPLVQGAADDYRSTSPWSTSASCHPFQRAACHYSLQRPTVRDLPGPLAPRKPPACTAPGY